MLGRKGATAESPSREGWGGSGVRAGEGTTRRLLKPHPTGLTQPALWVPTPLTGGPTADCLPGSKDSNCGCCCFSPRRADSSGTSLRLRWAPEGRRVWDAPLRGELSGPLYNLKHRLRTRRSASPGTPAGEDCKCVSSGRVFRLYSIPHPSGSPGTAA